MNRIQLHTLAFAVLTLLLPAGLFGQVYFTPNEGQWAEEVLYSAAFEGTRLQVTNNYLGFTQVATSHDHSGPGDHSDDAHQRVIGGHRYRINFLEANTPTIHTIGEAPHVENFFVGERRFWRGGVKPVEEVQMKNLYPGVTLHLYTRYNQLKYDLLAENAADVSQVKFYYEGADKVFLEEGRLHVLTSVGEHVEIRPYAYHPQTKKPIQAEYVLHGDTLSYALGPSYTGPVVVDPTFIFSTFTGSTQDNWGYSATFDPVDSSVYVAGIVYASSNPPTNSYIFTPGAFDTTYNGAKCDVAISKFSPDGTQLIYSTLLGGSGNEQPSSIVADSTGRLIVVGETGSPNFPFTLTGYDTTFNAGGSTTVNGFGHNQGSDLFVTVFEPDGQSLHGSTFIGGAGIDALNTMHVNNYGDWVRGEVIVSPWNTILVATNTASSDLPLVNNHTALGSAAQSGWILETSLDCSSLLWSTTTGGTVQTTAMAIRVSPSGDTIYVAGSTDGNINGTFPNGAHSSSIGGRDGYILAFDRSSRNLLNGTYTGTSSLDMNYLMDVDRKGNVYVYGQTLGTYSTSPGALNEPFSTMFVDEYSADLSQDLRAFAFGNKLGTIAISPTAFAVDYCGDVYLSGWGGNTNNAFSGGTTLGMTVTPDAFQDTTDGSDLYFAVVDASFSKFNYATFFGAMGKAEHVDGGTSRFDSKGVMYHATCANCGQTGATFPTFPIDVHSRVAGNSNCNLAVTVIAFDQQEAQVNIDMPDTVCSPFELTTTDTITGADLVIWNFGNGDVDTSFTTPIRDYTNVGTYTIEVIALDTNCGTSDTAILTFEVVNPEADATFTASYDPCDDDKLVNFEVTGSGIYYWDFGDGARDTTTTDASHEYSDYGPYEVTLIVQASNCFTTAYDTSAVTVEFRSPPEQPAIDVFYDGCANSGELRLSLDSEGWDSYDWQISDGQSSNSPYFLTQIAEGTYTVTVTVVDTVCGKSFTVSQLFTASADAVSFGGSMPNVFTPDRDGYNDYFQLRDGFSGNSVVGFSIKVYDRWGQLVFESSDINFQWNGTVKGRPLTEGVYFWVVNASSECGSGIEENGSVHIMKKTE